MRKPPRGQAGLEKAYEKFTQKDLSDKRLHICKRPISIKSFKNKDQIIEQKPNGLWYAIGDDWIQWCSSEMPHWLSPYIYEVILDESQILKIENIRQFEKFEKEYHAIPGWRKNLEDNNPLIRNYYKYHDINYTQVAEEYSGLEINPYLWEKRHSSMFYYGWDCASGCIWNKNAIKELKLIGIYNQKEDNFVEASLHRQKVMV